MWKWSDRACGRTARRLGEYLDGTLPSRQRHGVEAHLERCSACRRELAAMRGTLALLVQLPRRELSAEFDAAVRERIAGRRRPVEGATSGWAWMASLGSRPGSTERCLRAPWPSPARHLAPAGAMAAIVLGLFLARPALIPQKVSQARPVPVYVSVLVHEHQMLNAGADMNATVVGHNLNGDLLGDGDEE